jgi:hypothetical protein
MLSALEKLGAREFRMALLGLGLVVTSIAITTAFLPKVKEYRSSARAVTVLEAAKENTGDLDQQLQDRHANIEDLKFRLHGDMANLPLKQVESYVIGRLQKISWRNDVELLSVKPATGQQVQVFSEILFNIELVGEYDNIYHWLWDAKNELGFVVVKEYGMSRRDNIDDNPKLLAEVSLASYRAQQ